MPPPSTAGRPDTRHRLVEAGRRLFHDKGYAATGLSEVLSLADANSGSFYHFFESKDALLRTVLETYVDLLESHVVGPALAKSDDPLERIFALLDRYRALVIASGCQYGCPIGRLALEVDPENTPAHDLIARNFDAWKAAVEACLRARGVARTGDVATFVLTVMEGAVMQARAYRSVDPFDACIRQLRAYLERLPRVTPTRRVHKKQRRKGR